MRTIGAVMVAFVLVVVLIMAAHVVMFAMEDPFAAGEPVIWPAVPSLVFSAACGMIGGFGLAPLSHKAPMMNVTWFGAAWIPVALALPLMGDPVDPATLDLTWHFVAFL